MAIYVGLICIGLATALRASSAYIFATECLPVKERLQFGVYLFFCEGLSTVLTAIFFWCGYFEWRAYMAICAVIMTVALIVLFLETTESP